MYFWSQIVAIMVNYPTLTSFENRHVKLQLMSFSLLMKLADVNLVKTYTDYYGYIL